MRVCALGDSVVYGRGDAERFGWVGRLRERVEASDPAFNAVFNLGVGGDTSIDVVGRLDAECRARAPSLILLAFGVNDSKRHGGPDADRRVDVDTFRATVGAVLEAATALTGRTAFVGQVPVDESRTLPIGDYFHYRGDQEAYHVVTREACESFDVPYLDLFETWPTGAAGHDLMEDGLHPNTRGHEVIYREVEALLGSKGWLP